MQWDEKLRWSLRGSFSSLIQIPFQELFPYISESFSSTMLISEASDIYIKQKGIFILTEPFLKEKDAAVRGNIN